MNGEADWQNIRICIYLNHVLDMDLHVYIHKANEYGEGTSALPFPCLKLRNNFIQ